MKVSIIVELDVDTSNTPYCDESDNDIIIVAEKVESMIIGTLAQHMTPVKIGLYDLPVNVEKVDLDEVWR